MRFRFQGTELARAEILESSDQPTLKEETQVKQQRTLQIPLDIDEMPPGNPAHT